MKSLGFIKTSTVGIVEVSVKNGKYYYYSKRAGRNFPIKKSVVEQGEPV